MFELIHIQNQELSGHIGRDASTLEKNTKIGS